MGSMRFTKKDTGAVNSFDSSPQYSLPKMFGYAEGSVELEKTAETDMQITYTVRAKSNPDAAAHVVGTLTQKTKMAIWGELGRR